MMKKLLFLFIALIGFNSYARPLTEPERIAVEKTIREEMKDPDAAKFYDQDYPYPDSTHMYCGYVNGKNSYGAYAGKQLFTVFIFPKTDKQELTVASFDINSSTGEPTDPDVIASMCAGAGYDLPVKKIFFKGVNESRKKNNIPPLEKMYIKN
ncbi:hypothetical protein [Kosakonia radicincitans]|uniref:hypothetical protein n=1 Tax=Kosakonia radicincitans TaxID=283686 RepID=UPI0022B2EE0A|nr:hypothetical protein [Kosakonia radicincitans]